VTNPVWCLRDIVARRKRAKTYLLAHSSEWSLGERLGHYSMKLSHNSYFKSELRVRVRRFLRIRGEEGNALFEFGLVLPLLSMVLVGIIYSGITFYDYVTLADAVAIGARAIVTNRGAGTGPPNACALGETALDNAATSLKASLITIGTGAGTETFTGTGGSTCNALVAGDYVTVTAKYPCSLTIPFTGINLCPIQSGGSFISSSTTMRIE